MVDKNKKKRKKNLGGAPTVMTNDVLYLLDQAFMMGCSDKEACLYSGISKSTLYNYQQNNKQFVERKNLLKQNPALIARISLIKHMKNDGALALKFLERRRRKEFALRYEDKKTDENKLSLFSILASIDGSSKGLPQEDLIVNCDD